MGIVNLKLYLVCIIGLTKWVSMLIFSKDRILTVREQIYKYVMVENKEPLGVNLEFELSLTLDFTPHTP